MRLVKNKNSQQTVAVNSLDFPEWPTKRLNLRKISRQLGKENCNQANIPGLFLLITDFLDEFAPEDAIGISTARVKIEAPYAVLEFERGHIAAMEDFFERSLETDPDQIKISISNDDGELLDLALYPDGSLRTPGKKGKTIADEKDLEYAANPEFEFEGPDIWRIFVAYLSHQPLPI